MNRRNKALFLILGLWVVTVFMYLRVFRNTQNVSEGQKNQFLREQRNDLSRKMNKVKQEMLQKECEMLKIRHQLGQDKKQKSSASGGYCLHDTQNSHFIDVHLADAISQLLKGQRVAGFGDGPGMYKKHYDKKQMIASYHAYDGAPYIENVTDNAVRFMDLTVPQYGLPLYDWVVCLEVAEHIPNKYQDILVDNIARHAWSGIILSWAVPGQPGLNHVNNQSPEEVLRIMESVGFNVDDTATKFLKDSSQKWWFKQNINVYRRNPSYAVDESDA